VRARLDAGRRLAAEIFGSDLVGDTVELESGAAGGVAVREVTVEGRVVVANGALVHADLAELRARAREQAPRLWRRMEAIA